MEHYMTFASLVAQMVKRLPTMRETWVRSLGWEDPLEKEMATHSSILAWKIPWTGDPGRLQSIQSQRARHDWVTSLHRAFKNSELSCPCLLRWPTCCPWNVYLCFVFYGLLLNSFLCKAKDSHLGAHPRNLSRDLGHDHPLGTNFPAIALQRKQKKMVFSPSPFFLLL